MIRIAHLVWSARFGGIEKLVYDLATCQQRRAQADVSVIFAQGEGEFFSQYLKTGLRCHCLNLRHGFDLSPSKYRLLKSLFGEYDILHFHSFIPALTFIPAGRHTRIFYTEHGNFGFGRKIQAQDRVKRVLLRRFLHKRADFISFNSRFTQRLAHERYRLRDVDAEVVYNGIDLNAFSQSAGELDPEIASFIRGKFVIGTASRFAGFKRIDRLINAFAGFKLAPDSRLLLVGDGVLRPKLEALVQDLGISDRVIFAGYRSNVSAYLQAMHVCVFPSQNEPFGLVAVESLGLGKPTVVFEDAGGMAEVVQGIAPDDVVPDEAALCHRLGHYLGCSPSNQPEAARRIAYARRFNIEAMADRFAVLYQESSKCAR